MHSIRTYLLQALAEPAARGPAQFGDAALDGRLPVAGPLSGPATRLARKYILRA